MGPQLEQLFSILGVGIQTKEDFEKYKESYRQLRKREKVRNAVMEMQRKYGLPLAPNDSLGRTVMKVNLKHQLNKNPFDENDEGGKLK